MRRFLAISALWVAAAQGCIVYEDHIGTSDTACETDDTWATPTTPDTDEPEPVPQVAVYFTDADGVQGETLLTTMRAQGDAVDLSDVVSVRFTYGVDVLDTIVRADEVLLLLAVDAAAAPGEVDAFLTRADGSAGLVATPFQILAAPLVGGDDDDDATGDDDDDGTTTGDDDDSTPTDTGTGCVGPHCPDDTGAVDTGCPQ
jgi:hypothetical protein